MTRDPTSTRKMYSENVLVKTYVSAPPKLQIDVRLRESAPLSKNNCHTHRKQPFNVMMDVDIEKWVRESLSHE